MSWLKKDERNMRLFRHPPQHHEPPLGWNDIPGLDPKDFTTDHREYDCGDCGWTLEGGWEACDAHKEE